MSGNPFLRFQRAAEAAGYPALLIVSALCLGLVVAAVALLALTPTAFAFALAILNLFAAVAILSGAILAAIADVEAPAAATAPAEKASAEHATVVPFGGCPPADTRQSDRSAA